MVHPLLRARLLRSRGFLGVYDMSTMFFPASAENSSSSKPILPGSAPQTTSASSINRFMDGFWLRLALTVLILRVFFTLARFDETASATRISENSFDRAKSVAISDPTFPHPTTSDFSCLSYRVGGTSVLHTGKLGFSGEERFYAVQ